MVCLKAEVSSDSFFRFSSYLKVGTYCCGERNPTSCWRCTDSKRAVDGVELEACVESLPPKLLFLGE